MNRNCQIETLLRPIPEFYVAVIGYCISLLFLLLHSVLLLTYHIAIVLSMVIFTWATYRLLQGLKVYRYQKSLRQLPFYQITPDDIVANRHYLFLGRGFAWQQHHTQRLEDTKLGNNQHYLKPSAIAQWVRDKEKHSEVFYRLFHNQGLFNPFKPLSASGGNPAIHGVGLLEGERNIFIPLADRVGHSIVIGTTRVGKTRLAEVLITQDIKRGDSVIVLDPKGDADLMLTAYTQAKQMKRPIYLFHLGFPEISCRYNPIGAFSKITEVAGRISNQLPSDGHAGVFKDFAWGFINIVAQALVKIGDTPDFVKIRTYINDINPLIKRYRDKVLIKQDPSLANILKQIKKDQSNKPPKGKDIDCHALSVYQQKYNIIDAQLEGILAVFRYDNAYYSKLVASLRPLLDKLTSGKVAELLSPKDEADDQRPIIRWQDIIRQKAVVYVGLDALSDAQVAHAVGTAMFADLTSVAGEIYKFGIAPEQSDPPPISIHADEFNELIGEQFIPMINKAGGANYQITAYTQSIFDIESGIGNKAKAGVILDNFNTLIMFRVRSKESAELLVDKTPEYTVKALMTMAQASDSARPGDDIDFTSVIREQITIRTVRAISVNELVNLPKGQAFALLQGGKLYKLRLPLIRLEHSAKTATLPNQLAQMAAYMQQQYQSEFYFANQSTT